AARPKGRARPAESDAAIPGRLQLLQRLRRAGTQPQPADGRDVLHEMPRRPGPRALDGTDRAGRQRILVNAEDAEELFDPATARQPGGHRNEQTLAQTA